METKIEKLKSLVLKDAMRIRDEAGFSGLAHANGAIKLEESVKFYSLGEQGIIPPEWRIFEKQLDSEYLKYLELKKKFG